MNIKTHGIFLFQTAESQLPLPPEDSEEGPDDCRLWLGNLDTKITESVSSDHSTNLYFQTHKTL